MNRLVPEKRVDKNGRLVTRNVRAEDQRPTGASRIPAPAIAAAGSAARPPALKASPKQRETVRQRVHLRAEQAPDPRLFDSDADRPTPGDPTTYIFEASAAEGYEVFSAVRRSGDAVRLLSLGIRSAEEARAHLLERGAADLLGDRAAAAAVALGNKLALREFLVWVDEYAAEGRRDEDVAAAAAFALSGLSGAYTTRTSSPAQLIADGKISFEDIKTIGISRLRPFEKLPALVGVLEQMHAGQTDWTPQGIKDLLGRAQHEHFNHYHYKLLGSLLANASMERVAAVESVRSLVLRFATFTEGSAPTHESAPPIFRSEPREAAERALYVESVTASGGRGTVWRINEFYDAGIPSDVAGEVLAAGGGLTEARGIVEGGTPRGLASGYL